MKDVGGLFRSIVGDQPENVSFSPALVVLRRSCGGGLGLGSVGELSLLSSAKHVDEERSQQSCEAKDSKRTTNVRHSGQDATARAGCTYPNVVDNHRVGMIL